MARVVVVGSGIAGLVAALRAGERHEVTLVTKSELAESNTKYAQGGVAVALFPDDSVAAHVEDTLRVGVGLNSREAVEVLCSEGPQRVRDLIRLGVAFDRARNGDLARGREAAHSSARVVHAGGDATGAAIEAALVHDVRESTVRILEHTFLRDLVVERGRVVGVSLLGASSFEPADAVILASGGAGQLYLHTTNPEVTTGDGVAAAYRAGAVLEDLEFYQFHPTALAVPGTPLVSEAVRGEGAVLLSSDGRRFMTDVHPDAELAPRDVVARGIARQMSLQGGAPVLLDATSLGGSYLRERFPGIDRVVREHGLDWSTTPVPVTPAAHYWMGGVRTDVFGRTTVPGLYAVGEVACTGVHGANRLASNSLLESLVFAWRAVDVLDEPWPVEGFDTPAARAAQPALAGRAAAQPRVETLQRDAEGFDTAGARPAQPATRTDLQRLMWRDAGLFRSADGLAEASATLDGWTADGTAVEELETANLLTLARLVVTAAQRREESRGAHYREDFPRTLPAFAHHQDFAREVSIHADVNAY